MSRKLTEKAIKGVTSVSLSRYVTKGVKIVTNIFLARLLPPKFFGIMALSLFFLALMNKVKTFGFNQGLIHREKDLDEAKSTHFFLNSMFSFFSFIGTLFLFYVLQGIYSSLVLTIMLLLSFFSIFSSMSKTPRTILRKEMQFKILATLKAASTVVASITSILLAFFGFGIWSLVSRFLLERMILAGIVWFFSPWSLNFNFDKEIAKWFFRFGGFLFIGKWLGFLSSKYSHFLIGTIMGLSALGFYSKALTLVGYPAIIIASPIKRVATPLFTKLRDNRSRLSKVYNTIMGGVIRVSWPVVVSLFLVIPLFIKLLYGAKWLPTVPIFRFFALYGLSLPLMGISKGLCNMMGRPKAVTKAQLLQTSIIIPLATVLTYLYAVRGTALSMGISIFAAVLLFLLVYLPNFVDIAYKKVFVPPIIALVGSLLIFLPLRGYFSTAYLLLEILSKVGIFNTLYFLILLLIERERLIRMVKRLHKMLFKPLLDRI